MPGDWVIYRKQKHSASPGPRAKDVAAAPRGETYSYVVDKHWVVKQRLDDERVLLVTRTGKEHEVAVTDPNLSSVGWWQRIFYRERFRQAEAYVDR
jgi:hypothetical protein